MLKINDVSYCYEKDKYVLKNVNLTVEEDESVGIIGANGAGKSTLFSLICGLDYPSEGNIEFDGCNLSKKNLSLFRKNIGKTNHPLPNFIKKRDKGGKKCYNTLHQVKMTE